MTDQDTVERLPQEQIDRIKEETRSAEMDSHGKDANGQLDWPGMYAADCHMLLAALEAQRSRLETCQQLAEDLVDYGEGMIADADMEREYSVGDVRATGGYVHRAGERTLSALNDD